MSNDHRSDRPAPTRLLWAVGLSAALVYLVLDGGGPLWARLLLKPLPVLALAVWVKLTAPDRYGRCLTAGLLMALAGDIVLIWTGETAFLAGLAFNLVAHLCYIGAFLTTTRALRPARALPFLLAVGGLYAVLLPGLGGMTVPVALYATAIGSMMWRAAAQVGVSGGSNSSQWAGLIGAIGFAVCDSLIALNRFHTPIDHAQFLIMSSYWLGQLGLSLSARRTAVTAPDVQRLSGVA